jgi:transaldolase
MIDHPTEGDYARALLDEAVRESKDDTEAQVILQQKLVRVIAEKFHPIYEQSGGRDGFVSIQGDPINEHHSHTIVADGLKNRALGENICIKVPVTAAGLQAIQDLILRDVPINATEVFAVAQAVSLCETYVKATRTASHSPKMYISHIAGIYDDYLKKYVEEHNGCFSRCMASRTLLLHEGSMVCWSKDPASHLRR